MRAETVIESFQAVSFDVSRRTRCVTAFAAAKRLLSGCKVGLAGCRSRVDMGKIAGRIPIEQVRSQ